MRIGLCLVVCLFVDVMARFGGGGAFQCLSVSLARFFYFGDEARRRRLVYNLRNITNTVMIAVGYGKEKGNGKGRERKYLSIMTIAVHAYGQNHPCMHTPRN